VQFIVILKVWLGKMETCLHYLQPSFKELLHCHVSLKINFIYYFIIRFSWKLESNYSGTTVETETSSNDDFPPTNLISSNRLIRSKGFLADYFIKPPVGLRFGFRHPIHLCKVEFEPQVGQQVCDTFELWAWTSGQKCRFLLTTLSNKTTFDRS